MPKRRQKPKGEIKIFYNKRGEVVQNHSELNIKNHERVCGVSNSETDSVGSNATIVALSGRGRESATDDDSDASTVELNGFDKDNKTDGKERRNFQFMNNLRGKAAIPKVLANSSSTHRIINKLNCRSDLKLLNDSSRSILSDVQLKKRTESLTATPSSNCGYQNGRNFSRPCCKNDTFVLKGQQSTMLNSQVSITPCKQSSNTPQRNNEVSSEGKRREVYSVENNRIYTIDLTNSPKKRRRLSKDRSQEHPSGTNNAHVPTASQGCNNNAASPYMVIPLVDIRAPGVASKLAALGIRYVIPLSELHSTSANGMNMIPILNPVARNIRRSGASSFLPIDRLTNVTSQRKQ